jgi:hypothetical protein
MRDVLLARLAQLSDDDRELIACAIPALERLLAADPPQCNQKDT